MSTAKIRIRHKHFRLDSNKIARARRVLRARSETETVERALDFVLAEHKRNQLAWEAQEKFLQSGAEIKDVYGTVTK